MSTRRHRDRSPKPCPACAGKTRDGLLCRTCTDHTLRRLQDLPDLWVQLEQQITRRTRIRTGGQPHTPAPAAPAARQAVGLNLGQPGSRIPFDPHAGQIARNILTGVEVTGEDGRPLVVKGLRAWTRWTITQLHATPPKAGVTDMCEHLANHLLAIRRTDQAAGFAGDVWDWIDAITSAIDLPMRDSHIKVGPCVTQVESQWCPGTLFGILPQERDSTRPDRTPATFARCDTCGTEWPSSEFSQLPRRMLARRAEEARRRTLALEVARAVTA